MKKKLTTTLLLGLLAGGWTVSAFAREQRIVVGIVVDQLRTDYLQQLRPLFGSKGFNRLMDQGVFIPDVDFHGVVADAPSGAAVVFTGTWPAVSGVASNARIEATPENIRVSTLADEFYVDGGNLSKVYSISADAQSAMVMAGHAGQGAVWLDENTGKWTSPSYYGPLLPAVANKNRTAPVTSRMASNSWRPLNAPSSYPGGASWNEGNFQYSFAGAGRDAIQKYKASPMFNAEGTDLAIDVLKSLKASDGGMLNLAYSLAPYRYDYDGDGRPELVDAYVRLDAELGRLLDGIEKEYGRDGAVVFLSSTGYARDPEVPEGNARIPSGEVTLRQVESLLNSYLSATYGNGDYVTRIRDGKLFLDSKEASRKGLDPQSLRRQAKDFLLKMSGVSGIYTIDEVWGSEGPLARQLALSVDPKDAPDLFILFNPGWTVTDDNVFPSVSEKVRLTSPATPAFILAPGLPPQSFDGTVEATTLAPTVSAQINIRAPNAAASRPLSLRH